MLKRILLNAIAAFALPVLSHADELPQRASGLWDVSVTSGQSPSPNKMRECVDGASDAKLLALGADVGKSVGGACSKPEFKKTGAGFESHSECTMMGSKMISKGLFSGDFVKNYAGEFVTTFDPPLFGQKESTTKIAAKHIGPCGADMKPGDVIMANGMKMNMSDAAANLKASAQRFGGLTGSAGDATADPQAAMAEAMKQMDPKALEAMKRAMQQMGE
jgi:hypothetical protein